MRRVETIGFDYGQRHRVELDCRLQVRSRADRRIPRIGRAGSATTTCSTSRCSAQISDTALTDDARDRD